MVLGGVFSEIQVFPLQRDRRIAALLLNVEGDRCARGARRLKPHGRADRLGTGGFAVGPQQQSHAGNGQARNADVGHGGNGCVGGVAVSPLIAAVALWQLIAVAVKFGGQDAAPVRTVRDSQRAYLGDDGRSLEQPEARLAAGYGDGGDPASAAGKARCGICHRQRAVDAVAAHINKHIAVNRAVAGDVLQQRDGILVVVAAVLIVDDILQRQIEGILRRAVRRGLAAAVHIELLHFARPAGQVCFVVLMHVYVLDISGSRDGQAVRALTPANINVADVLSIQRQRQALAVVRIGRDRVATQHRHGAAVGHSSKGSVQTGASVAASIDAVGVIADIVLIVLHLGDKHLAACGALAVRVNGGVVTGQAACTGGLSAVGKVVGVGRHCVVLPLGQHSGAVLEVAGQVLLQITAAGIVPVVVAVHEGVRGRGGFLIYQIDRIARLQQVGHHLLVRAAGFAYHLDLSDLHRTLAGDLDAVCIRSDELRIAAVPHGNMTAVYPQRAHAAGFLLGTVDDGQDVILINDHLRGRYPEAVQIQRAATGRANIGHVVRRIVIQQLDDWVSRPRRGGYSRTARRSSCAAPRLHTAHSPTHVPCSGRASRRKRSFRPPVPPARCRFRCT